MTGPSPALSLSDGVSHGGCRIQDLPELHQLWRCTMPTEPLPAARFNDLLTRTGLHHIHLLRQGDRLTGFTVATADTGRTGWILAFGVASDQRGRGLGRVLLELTLAGLRQQGCERIAVGGPGETYLVPGIDLNRYPAADRTLSKLGFVSTGSTFGMESELRAAHAGTTSETAHPDLAIRPATTDERPAVETMIASCLSPSWATHLHDSDDWNRVSVAFCGGRPLGFAAFDMFPGCPGRFGPTGVIPDARGRGLGSALLHHTLAEMRAHGHDRAWFLWGPTNPAGVAMYRSAGFRVNRRFEFYTRPFALMRGDSHRGEMDGN